MKPPRKKPLQPVAFPHGPEAAAFTSGDAAALQAIRSGKANEGQQKRGLDWILNSACALPHWPYRKDARETDVALGRHFVGQQIIGLLRVNLSAVRQHEEHGEEPHD